MPPPSRAPIAAPTPVPGGSGLMLPGRAASRAAARAQARAHLGARDEWDLEEVDQASVVQAWWGGPEVGFVDRDHPGAEVVTVVHLPARLLATP